MVKSKNTEDRKLVNDAYETAKNILGQNKESLQKLAELLLQKEVVYKEDIGKILGKRSDGETASKTKFQKTDVLNS